MTAIEWTWTTVATASFLGVGACGVLWAYTAKVVRRLSDVSVGDRSVWPPVSIVVAARNEERNIEQGVRSLLALDYPELQITVVNDRSTDGTATILSRIAAEDPRLNVVAIDQLPPGWLGKNNALHVGARRSTGDWLLFTDADIIFAPDTLRKAIPLSEDHQLDHLAAAPRVITPSFWLRAFVPVFSMFFVLYVKAWAVRNKNDRSAWVGVGAFNLVRATAYWAIGGHEQLRLRPDDDVRLGKQLKESGFQADFVDATDQLSVEWYSSVGELIRGLEKNAFAATDYRCSKALFSMAFVIVGFVMPFVAMFIAPRPANLLFALAAGIAVIFAGRACRSNGQPGVLGVLFPVGVLLLTFIQLRTMLLTLWQGGIRWRDTFYSLEELRQNVA